MAEKGKRQPGKKKTNTEKGSVAAGNVRPNIMDLLARLGSSIKVVHGVNDDTFDGLVGQKVSTVRDSLRDAFNIPEDVIALVNHQPVEDTYTLKKNDVLEFIRRTGVRPSPDTQR
jgi:sulfur carrier protein ThiS